MTDESEVEQQINGNEENGETSSLNSVTVNETGFCTLCGKHSVCKCERCGDFYCSPLCQRKDWPNHRFICFPLPRLVKAGQQPTKNVGKVNNTPTLKADVSTTKKEEEHRQRCEEFVPMPTPVPASGSCVILTGFESSDYCYIRSANPSITEEYKKVLSRIDEFGQTSKGLNIQPKPNSYSMAQKNDKWCRVVVLANAKNRIRVQFIDYGFIALRSTNNMRKISRVLSSLPCYVNKVQLHGITKYCKDSNSLDKLSEFIEKEYKIEFIKETGHVELYHWGTDKLLNSQIVAKTCASNNDNGLPKNTSPTSKLNGSTRKAEIEKVSSTSVSAKEDVKVQNGGDFEKANSDSSSGTTRKRNLSSAPKQIQIQKPCLEPPFETIPLDKNERNFKVFIVDCAYIDRGYIGCLLEKYCDNLKAITKFLKEYKDNGQTYKPQLNEYCLAQYENEWYRAKVIEVLPGDKYQVVYIDFSNELQVSSEDIRRYPMSLTLPCYTSLCAIENFPEEISEEAIEFLRKEYDFEKLTIDRVKIEDGITFVESKELLTVLHESNLI